MKILLHERLVYLLLCANSMVTFCDPQNDKNFKSKSLNTVDSMTMVHKNCFKFDLSTSFSHFIENE